MTNQRRDELVQQVKDAVDEVNSAVNALMVEDESIKVEFTTVAPHYLGRPFPTEKLQVKLSEVKTL